eukprot:1105351-Prymnesium_polylepis.2
MFRGVAAVADNTFSGAWHWHGGPCQAAYSPGNSPHASAHWALPLKPYIDHRLRTPVTVRSESDSVSDTRRTGHHAPAPPASHHARRTGTGTSTRAVPAPRSPPHRARVESVPTATQSAFDVSLSVSFMRHALSADVSSGHQASVRSGPTVGPLSPLRMSYDKHPAHDTRGQGSRFNVRTVHGSCVPR